MKTLIDILHSASEEALTLERTEARNDSWHLKQLSIQQKQLRLNKMNEKKPSTVKLLKHKRNLIQKKLKISS